MKFENTLRVGCLVGFASLFLVGSVQAAEGLEPTWVRPDTDFSAYNKFLVKPLEIDDVKVVRPPWAADDPREWSIDIEDSIGIQALYADAMEEELTADGAFDVVDTFGPGVLEVKIEILRIMPYRRPGDEGTVDGMQVTTLGSGELTGVVEIRDSVSRRLLLLKEGDTVIGQEYKDWSYLNNVANLDTMFRGFAKNLRTALEQAQAE